MSRTLVLIALVALATTAVGVDPPKPRLIDFNPWAWLPANRNRSPSIMDYFFPPSRTPKHSNLDPPADRQPPQTTTVDSTLAPSTVEERSTTLARKASSKVKTTLSAADSTATIVPKIKKSPNPTSVRDTTIELKSTQTIKINSPAPTSTKDATASSTPRPTKHYTIKPVRTETPTVQDTDTTNTDSMETLTDTAGTTVDGPKDTVPILSTAAESRSTDSGTASTVTMESTTQTESTLADSPDSREGYLPLRDKPQQTHVKINEQTKKETVPLPAGSTSVLAKPTKYHYYPHNQHIYLLPECAIQQVCNAVYVRLNYTQPLCACPARYRDPCSASLNADDLHTTRLTTDSKKKYAHKAVTLVKTCEAVSEMRECRAPRDWSLLALQNIRTGKSHYLVICRCPENHILEGPMSHDQPTYASVPGIRVYGMMCVRPSTPYGYNANRFTGAIQSTTSAYKVDYSQPHTYDKPVYNRYNSHNYLSPNYYNRRSRVARVRRAVSEYPPFPWYKVRELARSLHWID